MCVLSGIFLLSLQGKQDFYSILDMKKFVFIKNIITINNIFVIFLYFFLYFFFIKVIPTSFSYLITVRQAAHAAHNT